MMLIDNTRGMYFLFLLCLGVLFNNSCRSVRDTLTKEQIEKANMFLEELNTKNRESWIDPFDMFAYDPLPKDELKPENMKPESVEHKRVHKTDNREPDKLSVSSSGPKVDAVIQGEQQLDAATVQSIVGDHKSGDYVFLSRWIKKFLSKISINHLMPDQRKIVSFPITIEKLQQLKAVIDVDVPNMHDVEAVVSDAFADVEVSEEVGWFGSLSHVLSNQDGVMFSCAVALVFSTVFIIRQFSARPKLTSAVVAALLSICWHWMKLYKQLLARKHAMLEEVNFDMSCKKKDFGVVESVYHYFRSYFVSGGECTKYFEAIMVDPFWEASPSQAISDTLSTFVFHPMQVFADILNSSTRALFSDLSMAASFFVVMFIFFLMLYIFGYRLRFPLFLGSLEPVTSDPQMMHRINTLSQQVTQLAGRVQEHNFIDDNVQVRQLPQTAVPANESIQPGERHFDDVGNSNFQDKLKCPSRDEANCVQSSSEKYAIKGTLSQNVSEFTKSVPLSSSNETFDQSDIMCDKQYTDDVCVSDTKDETRVLGESLEVRFEKLSIDDVHTTDNSRHCDDDNESFEVLDVDEQQERKTFGETD